jgi:photosystem I subunit V
MVSICWSALRVRDAVGNTTGTAIGGRTAWRPRRVDALSPRRERGTGLGGVASLTFPRDRPFLVASALTATDQPRPSHPHPIAYKTNSKVHKSLAVKSAPGAVASCRSTTKAFSDVQLVISGCNGLALALGRFVFLPVIREKTAMQGPGVQNGESHFAAGDARSEEAASVFATNDPAGFTIVDLFAWGSIGHAVGYVALATASFQELQGTF